MKISGKKTVCFFFTAGMAASALLIFFLPTARHSFQALCNRLFDASEKANAYIYDHFPVPDGQSAALAWVLAAVFAACYFGLAAVLRSKTMLLLFAISAALTQAYFGLSLPAIGNMTLYFSLGLMAVLFSTPLKKALPFSAALVSAFLLTAALWPGVDAATETASERIRDRLAPLTLQEESVMGENPYPEMETRHMNARSLLTGNEIARQNQQYRLLTVEKQQISRPRWIDYLKIALLLALSAAVVVLPFLPFLYVNNRRKKAQEARLLFQADNAGEAICAMFRHAAAYLQHSGFGGGNRPYRQWPEIWQDRLPEQYQRQFSACARLFEEAAYSDHRLTEEQREQVRLFFSETERIFFDEADWKEKLRLRYIKCLHE